ncbi:MAG: phenylalanine 4-monooxygenase [Bacteroidia bacterium]
MKQNYSNYTNEHQQVWKILFDRQMAQLETMATNEYLQGLDRIAFNGNVIPNFSNTNELLQKLTGWQVYAVPGIVADDTFFDLMSAKKFPATTWVRKMSELDYLEEPDMFHDVFAHVPMLTNPHFANFLQELSKLGKAWLNNDRAIHLLSRIYWYTAEFGLINENNNLKIYGAGILSSFGESKYSLSNEPEHKEFDIKTILNTTYRKDKMQEVYFIIEGYSQLYEAIPTIKNTIESMLEEEMA